MQTPTITKTNAFKTARWSIVWLLIVSLLVVAHGMTFAQGGGNIPAVTAVASDDGLTLPSEVPAGLVTFLFENNRTDAGFEPTIVRLNDGVTAEDVMAAPEDEGITMVSFYGGAIIPPGSSSATVTTRLSAGDYALMTNSGEIATFTVTGEDAMDVEAPAADVHLTMIDFGFGIPGFIPAGPSVWRLDNVGEQWHHMGIFPIDDGLNVAEVRELMASGGEEPAPVYFTGLIGPGVENWVTIDLEPGTYLLICFLPDVNGDGTSHFMKGMMQVFIVE